MKHTEDIIDISAKVADLYERGRLKGAARLLRQLADAIEREQNAQEGLTPRNTTRT